MPPSPFENKAFTDLPVWFRSLPSPEADNAKLAPGRQWAEGDGSFISLDSDDESTWSEMPVCVGSLATSAALVAIWRSLDVVQQRHLLPQIVDRVEPHRTKPELRITFDPRIVGVVITQKTASEAPRVDRAGR